MWRCNFIFWFGLRKTWMVLWSLEQPMIFGLQSILDSAAVFVTYVLHFCHDTVQLMWADKSGIYSTTKLDCICDLKYQVGALQCTVPIAVQCTYCCAHVVFLLPLLYPSPHLPAKPCGTDSVIINIIIIKFIINITNLAIITTILINKRNCFLYLLYQCIYFTFQQCAFLYAWQDQTGQ